MICPEKLDSEHDDGTMPENVALLEDKVVGHRIVSAERIDSKYNNELCLTLDNGKRVKVRDTSDCCAYTTVEAFLFNPEKVDNVILGVRTTDKYETWHIYADGGDVLKLTVGWSCGNPFYYGYGFDIQVEEA